MGNYPGYILSLVLATKKKYRMWMPFFGVADMGETITCLDPSAWHCVIRS